MKSRQMMFHATSVSSFAILFLTISHAQVTGSGISHTVPIWTGKMTLSDSPIVSTGGNVKIGSGSAIGRLNVETPSTTLDAIFGTNSATSGNVSGVFGSVNSPTGNGVLGANNATTGYAAGVTGFSMSPGGPGVNGFSLAASGGFGVFGATSTSGTAITGINQNCSTSPCTPVPGTAGYFETGVGGTILVGAVGTTPGLASTTVFSVDSSGDGYFAGNLNVTGNLTKGSGSFKIDHPLDPANKYLEHSFVESPDMMNIYNGVVALNNQGEALVRLPEYFQALNGDFRYQLTPIGAPGPNLYIAEEISENHFKIAGGKPGARVSWQITGVRHDAYANAHRILVEEEKPQQERGRYLHPELFGGSEKQAIGAANLPQTAVPVTMLATK